ncbi:MAG: hypothetical protein HWN67_01110 [Candidatus Helarchaeota archaeon]|nr:hypothetical protein [Candidatus Helarchaeota archaeon]
MRRNKTFIIICAMSLTLVILFSTVLRTQVTGNTSNGYSNGLIPYNGDSVELNTLNLGYNVSVGLSWEQEITVLNNTYLQTDFTAGDRFRYTVKAINNSVVDINGYINQGYTVFGDHWYFNSTERNWVDTEMLLGIYNDTNTLDLPFTFGNYSFYSELMNYTMTYLNLILYDCLPSNFSAANHTIVNGSYLFFGIIGTGPFNYNVTPGGNIASNWTIWSGSATNNGSEPNTYRLVYVFNDKGVCNLTQVYVNGTTSWEKAFELKLVRMGPAYPLDFGNILGSYTYKVTTANPVFPFLITVGDKYTSTVINILRDVDIGGGDFVDIANGSFSYYYANGSKENYTSALLSMYNKTHSFDAFFGLYHYISELTIGFMMTYEILDFNFLPLDFFAANDTIVGVTHLAVLMDDPASNLSYSYTQNLSTNSIAGTWTMWNGTAGNNGTEAGTLLINFTYNSEGILTSTQMYANGTTSWDLLLEIVLLDPYIVLVSRDPFTPVYLDSVNVSVHITDKEGVDTVLINSNHTGTPLDYEMDFLSGSYQNGYWNYIIPAYPAGTTITYSIWANDTSNNPDTAGPYQYIISALYPYDFGNIIGSYIYNVTTANPGFPFLVTAGDMFNSTVINILRGFDIGGGNFVDVANGSWSYYNSTDGSTLNYTSIGLSAYNKTHSFDIGLGPYQYISEVTQFLIMNYGVLEYNFLPLDFFAANATIVGLTHFVVLMGDPASAFHYSFTHDLSTNSIAGTWTMWNGTAGNDGTEAGTLLMKFTYNSEGILTLTQMYIDDPTGWDLVLEIVLIEEAEGEEEAPLGLLLLGALAGGAGGLGMMEILIIAVIAGIGVIILAIAIAKAKR